MDSMPHDEFIKSKEKQKKFEAMFVQWIGERENVANVRKANMEEDKRGIDFFVTNEDATTYTVQLKVDFWTDRTGNLPCEAISQAYWHRNSVIGAEFSMAEVDFIFFLLVPSMKVLGYKFQHFLRYAIEHYKDFKNFARPNSDENGNLIYTTLGALIPAKDVNHLLKVDEIIGG